MAAEDDDGDRLNLLLAEADETAPVLGRGLPGDTAQRGKKAKKGQGGDDTKRWRRIDADWNDLTLQRWAVIAPRGKQGSAMLEAIQDLIHLREEEQGVPAEIYRMPPDLDSSQAKEWLLDDAWKEKKDEEDQPLYLLVLGDLHQISEESQHGLANGALVGRVHFADEDGETDLRGYEAYAKKVARFAREGTPDTAADMLFFVADDGTSATHVGETKLVAPSLAAARSKMASDKLQAAGARKLTAEDADELLAATLGARPSVMLSVSHGLGPPRRGFASEEERWRRQGALVFGRGEVLEAEQLRGQRFLPGGLWFYLACFGAGTPSRSAYGLWLSELAQEGQFSGDIKAVQKALPKDGERAFLAALPQAALANPEGPLAVVGHLDLAWTYSFTSAKNRSDTRSSRIFSTLEVMVRGSRAGVAMHKLLETYRDTNDELLQIHERAKNYRAEKKPDPTDRAEWGHLWMLRNDLRGYVLLGDPAVRLPLAQFALRRPAPPAVPEVRVTPSPPDAPMPTAAAPRAVPPDPAGEPGSMPPSVKAEASVFLFQIAPAPGASPEDVEQRLLAQPAAFALAARPTLDPAMLSHTILRGTDGRHAWQIIAGGIDSPPEDAPPAESLGEALLDEVRGRLAGFAEVTSCAAYADLSLPAPGPGFGRPEGAESFSEDLPGWEAFAIDSGAPEAGQPLPDDLLAEIEQSRASVRAEPGLKAWGKGHMYGGGADKAHVAYLNSYLETRAARANPSDRRKIKAFHAFQAREGSTAAINTYDNQIVTWGTGWGGLGWMGKVVERAVANPTLRDRFGSAGLRYRGKNVYDVVDLRARKVVTGKKDALEVIRRSIPLLYLLIDVARDPATRDAVTEAQLVTFMGGSGNIAGCDAVATQALFNLIAHLKHWAPGYVMGCLEWAVPQAGDGPASADRDRRLAVLAGRYFYGTARKYKWIPSWQQFQLYFRHMKEDGLDCMSDPFIQAAGPPQEDPFAGVAPAAAATAPKGAAAGAPQPALQNKPLAGQPEIEGIARGKGVLRRGAKGAGVTALQEALIALGFSVPGGADGAFGPGLERTVKAFQEANGLAADGIVGPGTLKAIDARLSAHPAR